LAKPEIGNGIQNPAHTCENAVAPAGGKLTSEDLENALSITLSRAERGLEHGELVAVSHQGIRHGNSLLTADCAP